MDRIALPTTFGLLLCWVDFGTMNILLLLTIFCSDVINLAVDLLMNFCNLIHLFLLTEDFKISPKSPKRSVVCYIVSLFEKDMKRLSILGLIFLSINCHMYGQIQSDVDENDTIVKSIDSAKATKAINIALKYVRLFSAGNDVQKIFSLCSVPFIWPDKKIILNFSLLRQKHIETINLKGKNRTFEVDTAYIKGITQNYSKQNTTVEIYQVKFRLKNPKVSSFVVFVQMSEIPKIVGLKD